MHVQLRIDEEGLLRNQHHAFTNRFTLVTELLQNARRSGATRIQITHDEAGQVLRVVDDGCGISDFQDLLTFYRSGWDKQVREDETPFGIGFSKALYASTRCIVTSLGRTLDADTQRILTRKPIAVVDATSGESLDRGTTVELHGVALPGLDEQIELICRGFPAEVEFNGLLLERRHAEAKLATTRSAIGAVYLAPLADDCRTNEAAVFLQGISVQRPRWHGRTVDVVHLDPRQFMARLPDRDRLIDEDIRLPEIGMAVRSCWRTRLLDLKRSLPATEFVEACYPAMRAWDQLDLLNDVDILPSRVCRAITGYPIQELDEDDDHLSILDQAPARSDIESGVATLAVLEPVDETNVARWMLARAKGWTMVDRWGLHEGHWVHAWLKNLEEPPLSVTAVAESNRMVLDGNWIWPELVFCASVRIQVGDHIAEVSDAGVFHGGCIYVPDGEASGDPVRQASTYTDDCDQFLAGDLELDRRLLEEQIRRIRVADPAELLRTMLETLLLGNYPVLHGCSFDLAVGVGDMPGFSLEVRSNPAPRDGEHCAQ